jgi:flagellar motor protein MotB
MGWAKSGLITGVLLSAFSAGCQNKLYDQNKALYDENKALRDQNERIKQQQTGAQPPAQPVQPQTLPGVPPTVADNQPPSQPPDSSHKAVDQIGGLETTVTPRGNTVVHLPSKLFFAPGQATLVEASKVSLNQVASALNKKFAGKNLRVEGHTDSTPIRVSKWKSNQQLSEARADAVRKYLVSKGVDADRITIKGLGDTHPRSTTDLSLNRRVEIVVLTGSGE